MEFIVASNSCSADGEGHCGHCEGCQDRWVGFQALGIEDPSYAEKPTQAELLETIRSKRWMMPGWVNAYRKAMGVPEGELILV